MKILIMFFVFMSVSQFGFAEDGHLIDVSYHECIEQNKSTAGRRNCGNEALAKWVKLINSSYSELLRLLDEDQKSELRKSHIAWVNYKEWEYRNFCSLLKNKRGTMWGLYALSKEVKLAKQRALELNSYIDLVELGR